MIPSSSLDGAPPVPSLRGLPPRGAAPPGPTLVPLAPTVLAPSSGTGPDRRGDPDDPDGPSGAEDVEDAAAPIEVLSAAPYAPAVSATFDDFYRTARPTIARALALSIGDADLAAEATDEAMTRAYERWHRVSTMDRPEAWVYRVASNWAMSIFRRRRRSLHPFYDPAVTDPASTGDPAVHLAVAALDPKHRSVIVCRHLLGWTVAETALALGISEGTVKSRSSRAAATLRARLHDVHADADPKDAS